MGANQVVRAALLQNCMCMSLTSRCRSFSVTATPVNSGLRSRPHSQILLSGDACCSAASFSARKSAGLNTGSKPCDSRRSKTNFQEMHPNNHAPTARCMQGSGVHVAISSAHEPSLWHPLQHICSDATTAAAACAPAAALASISSAPSPARPANSSFRWSNSGSCSWASMPDGGACAMKSLHATSHLSPYAPDDLLNKTSTETPCVSMTLSSVHISTLVYNVAGIPTTCW
mmetsp:Transcript_6724/g.16736  ORF Transcript_6724/g.16736 Transcript_6724/m.16736 type:complete len:230 (-) Transcript_6724:92-781(-)